MNLQGNQGIFKSEHHVGVYGIALKILLFYTLLPESQRMQVMEHYRNSLYLTDYIMDHQSSGH